MPGYGVSKSVYNNCRGGWKFAELCLTAINGMKSMPFLSVTLAIHYQLCHFGFALNHTGNIHTAEPSPQEGWFLWPGQRPKP